MNAYYQLLLLLSWKMLFLSPPLTKEKLKSAPVSERISRAATSPMPKSLQGNFREVQLFLLKECYSSYCYYIERIAVCDQETQRQLQVYPKAEASANTPPAAQKEVKKRAQKNHPAFNTLSFLKAIHGVDVMALCTTAPGKAAWRSSKPFWPAKEIQKSCRSW